MRRLLLLSLLLVALGCGSGPTDEGDGTTTGRACTPATTDARPPGALSSFNNDDVMRYNGPLMHEEECESEEPPVDIHYGDSG